MPARGDRQTIDDGHGDAIRRRYSIALPAGSDPTAIIDALRENPNRFCPVNYAAFTGALRLGERVEVRLAGPWKAPVEVARSDATTIRLVTLDGHMEAGWIDFSADGARFTIESLARAGNRGFLALFDIVPFARWVQTDMWSRVCENIARYAGDAHPERVRVTTVRIDDDS